jgi:ubiquitin-conjugating enzyme E2 O
LVVTYSELLAHLEWSRLYSEKAYVLSRGFVRRALEIPMGGLEAEIRWFYRNQKWLQKVIDDARRLIVRSTEQSQSDARDSDAAVTRLTAGGIISLERVLSKLQALLENTV